MYFIVHAAFVRIKLMRMIRMGGFRHTPVDATGKTSHATALLCESSSIDTRQWSIWLRDALSAHRLW